MWSQLKKWSHYANDHKGFVIGFCGEDMINSEFYGKGAKVSYSESFPNIDPMSEDLNKSAFIETHTKAEQWHYEKEFRFAKTYYPKAPLEKDRVIKFSDDVIEEIILGCDADEETISAIVKLAKEKGIKNIYQTVKIPFRFELDRIPVDIK